MKTILNISAVAICLVVAPSPSFALWTTSHVSKEQAKAMGMEVRSAEAGPNQVQVELEFKTEGRFEKFIPEGKFASHCGVELRIGEGKNSLVTAPLREDRSRSGQVPGRVVFSFTADRAQLEKLRLWVYAPESDGGTIYDLAVKDFVELKKGP
jgi:hypothetical protein